MKPYDLKIDWKIPVIDSYPFKTILSAGGKYNYTNRISDNDRYSYNIQYGAGRLNREKLINTFDFLKDADPNIQTGGIDAKYFLDKNYNRRSILDYPVGPGYDVYRLADMMNTIYPAWKTDFQYDASGSLSRDYNDKEKTFAGYVMGEFRIEKVFTIVPGIRFQQKNADVSAYQYILSSPAQEDIVGDSPVLVHSKKSFPAWYPSLHIKFEISNYMSFIGAVYKSVAYPGYWDMSPLVIFEYNKPLITGNPLLKPTTVWNIDFRTSIFSNETGVLTADFFYKEISDLISNVESFYPFRPFPVNNVPSDLNNRLPATGYYDSNWAVNPNREMVNGSIAMNNLDKAYMRCVEFSWQTYLWYLPKPFDGFHADMNLTLMNSRQQYPYFALKKKQSILNPDTLVYGTNAGPLQNQPSVIYNAIVGWDYKGTSITVGYKFHNKTLFVMDTQYGLRNCYIDNISLLDLSVIQEVMSRMSVFLSASKINASVDEYYYSHPSYYSPSSNATAPIPAGKLPTMREKYGWIIQAGVSYGY